MAPYLTDITTESAIFYLNLNYVLYLNTGDNVISISHLSLGGKANLIYNKKLGTSNFGSSKGKPLNLK